MHPRPRRLRDPVGLGRHPQPHPQRRAGASAHVSLAEYAVLARRLGANDAAGALASLQASATDPALVERARRHQLISLLWATIPENALRTVLPAEAFATFDEWLRRPRRRRPEPAMPRRRRARFLAPTASTACLSRATTSAIGCTAVSTAARNTTSISSCTDRPSAAARTLRALGYVVRWQDLHSATWKRGAPTRYLALCISGTRRRIDSTRGAFGTTASATASRGFASRRRRTATRSSSWRCLSSKTSVSAPRSCGRYWTSVCSRRASMRGSTGRASSRVASPKERSESSRTSSISWFVSSTLRLHCRAFPRRWRIGITCLPFPTEIRRSHLLFAERSALGNRAWFFRVYPGSVARYWLWLLPRKVPLYLRREGAGPGGELDAAELRDHATALHPLPRHARLAVSRAVIGQDEGFGRTTASARA